MAFDFAAEVTAGLASIQEAAGVTVRYQRGVYYMDVAAVPGATNVFSAETGSGVGSYGVSVNSRTRDYMIRTNDFDFTASTDLSVVPAALTILPNIPLEGDFIIQEINGRIETYEILKRFGSKSHQVWRWQDSNHTFMRIHTQYREIPIP